MFTCTDEEREPARIPNDWQIGVDRVQLAPEHQWTDEREGQHVHVGAAQPPLPDQPLHDVLEPVAPVAHSLVQVDAADLGQAHAVRHQNPKQFLLLRLREALERRIVELQERGPAIDDRRFGQRRQALGLQVLLCHQQRIEQRFLAGEVVVEGAFADADGRCDVAQAGAEIPLLSEEVERGVQD